MRKLVLGSPSSPIDIGWCQRALKQIEQASRVDVETVFDGLTITGSYATTRTLDASATLPQLVAFIATMVTDIQKRGQNRTGA